MPTEGRQETPFGPDQFPFRQAALAVLKRVFGFSAFRPGQEAALRALAWGRDLLAVMPTGSGKSLCYQLPACLRPGLVLVVSPLIALMKDQVDNLRRLGIAAVQANSALTAAETRQAFAEVATGRARLLYVSPEGLRSRSVRGLLTRARPWLLVIDEAHCISTWGHDFRPEYRRIGQVVRELGRPIVAAFTASATQQTRTDIAAQLSMKDPARVVAGFDRPELLLEVYRARDDGDKLDALARTIAEVPGPIVVYCGTRRAADLVADFARTALNVVARAYHAGMSAEARTAVQEAFLADEVRVVAATSAFGLGIDKPDIRAVVHHCFPGSLEAYCQEIGRAGRDGRPARAVLLYLEEDKQLHEYFIDQALPAPDLVSALADALPAEGWVDRRALAGQFNEPEALVEAAIWQLVLLGCLAIEDMGPAGLRVRRLPTDEEPAIRERYAAQVASLRASRLAKLAAVRDYARSPRCRRRKLLAYFDSPSGAPTPCCDVCQAGAGSPPTQPPTGDDDAIVQCVEELGGRVGRTAIASILTGSRSKRVQELGGPSLRTYGALKVGRDEVLQRIDALIARAVLALSPGPYPVVLLPGRLTGRPPPVPEPGPGRAYLEASRTTCFQLGVHHGWALTSYFRLSGSSKSDLGDHLEAFKYGQKRERGRPLAEGLVGLVHTRTDFAGAAGIVPVPGSIAGRQFDPATELATMVAAEGGPPCLPLLVKGRETASQKNLRTADARRANVAGSFVVRQPERVAGRKVILLDDFIDSGATIGAAAEALLAAGAAEIVLLAIATTNRQWR